MSVQAGGGGAESIAGIEIDVALNDAAARLEAERLASTIADTGNKAAGNAAGGFRIFGSAAVSSLGGVITQAQNMDRAFGGASPLAPLAGGLMSIQGPLTMFGSLIDKDKEKLQAMEVTATAFQGVGLIMAGVAGAAAQMSGPLQDANAMLSNSVANTKNATTGLADSVDNYTGKIKDAIRTGASYGYSADQVTQVIGQLTEETRSAPEAFKELGFAETLAAASHMKLYTAGQFVGRMHAGLFRALRQFGIDIPSLLINPEKQATTAANELAKATQGLQRAQENLNAYQQQVQAAEQARQESWANKVQAAEQTAANAQQRYQQQLTSVTDAEEKMQLASETAQQSISANAQKLAADQQAANQGVADAQQRIQDLKQQWAAQDAQTAGSTKNNIASTAQALADAESNLQTLTAEWSLTPARSAQAQLAKLDQLRHAVEAVQKARAAQAKAEATGHTGSNVEITRRREMHAAQEALNRAEERQRGLAEEAHKMALENAKAQNTARLAVEAYAKAQDQAAAAQRRADEAEKKLAADQQAAAHAGDPTAAEKNRIRTLEDAVQKQKDAIAKAHKDQQTAADFQKKLNQQFTDAENQFMTREGGLLGKRQHTWIGHFRAWEASIKNVVMNIGQNMAPLMLAGMALTGVGTLGRMGGAIKDAIKKMKGGEELEKDAKKSKGALKDVEAGAKDLEGGFGSLGTTKDNLGQNFKDFGGKLSDTNDHIANTADAGEQLQMQFEHGGNAVEESGSKIAHTGEQLSGMGKEAEGLAGAVGKSGALGEIATAGEGMAGAVAEGGAGVIGSIGGILPAIMGPQALIIGAIAAIAVIGYVIYRNWGTISHALVGAWDWMFKEGRKLFGVMERFIKQWWEIIPVIFTGGALLLPMIIVKYWRTILSDAEKFGGMFLGWVGKAWGAIKGAWQVATDAVGSVWHSFWTGLIHFAGGAISIIIKGFEAVANGAFVMVENMLEAASHLPFVGGKFKSIENDLKSFQQNMDSTLSGVADDMSNWGSSAGQGMVDGMHNALTEGDVNVAEASKKLSADAIKSMREAAQTASPSRLTFQVGRDIARGAWLGMESEKPKVDKTAGNLFDPNTLSPSSSIAPTRAGGGTTFVLNVDVHVQGTVIAERQLQQSLKEFLQQGALQNGGLLRFLGVPNSSQ